MIITKSWLQEFIDISKISTEDICKTLNSIGLEVDSVAKIEIPKGIVVGYIKECEKHPDADKLSVCQVSIGDARVEQIVCGAKNVAAGQYVPVATVGCVLGEDFKIKKAKLRGVESNGMICSSTEIGLAKLNDGILELDDSIGDLIIGKELNTYPLLNDDIIEIELTANRGDCLSIHGIARELSAYYKLKINEFDRHEEEHPLGIGQVLTVESAKDIESSFIYKGGNLDNFKLPVLQKIRTGIIDEYSPCDILALRKYVIHSTGVLLNIYNTDFGHMQTLNITKDKNGFDTVSNGDKKSTVGIETKEFDPNGNDIIIEAAYIEPDVLAQRVFETKIKTSDIYYRSSRGSEPSLSMGIDYLCTMISEFGGNILKGTKYFTDEFVNINIDIDFAKVDAIVGQHIDKFQIETILQLLGFNINNRSDNVLNVSIPQFRHDIKNIADITEEIVRIVGIDNIKAKPLAIDEVNRINATSLNLIKKNDIRAKAVSNGFFETLTYVFASREVLEKYGFETVSEKKDILNPITNELNTFRTTLLTNLIEAVSNNTKHGFKRIAFFEMGSSFDKDRNEKKSLSFVFSGSKEEESISNNGKPEDITFFEFASKISAIIGKFELEPLKEIDNKFVHPYQSGNIIVDGETIGFISKLHPEASKDFDISDSTFICEIDFTKLNSDLIKAQDISKFQSSKRDLSLVVPKSLEYKQIKDVINSLNIEDIKQFNLIDVYSDEKLGENESLTIRFVLQSDTKTFEDEDINKIMDSILTALEEKLDIKLR